MPSVVEVQVVLKVDGVLQQDFPLVRRITVDEAQAFTYDIAGGGGALAAVPAAELTTSQLIFLYNPTGAVDAQLYSTANNYIPLSAGGFILVVGALNTTAPVPLVRGTGADTTTQRGLIAGT